MSTEEKSFLKSIWENKFLKYILPYGVGSWGFIQVAAFLESRYSWASHWPDFILVLVLTLIPSVILFSYYRSNTQSDRLVKFEKIFIPINLVLAITLASFGIGQSDLKAKPSKISLVNEEGETVERIVPNISTTKRVVLLPWESKTDDPKDQWMNLALPHILAADLEQDNRLISIDPKALPSYYTEYSANLDKAPPFSIQRKIASDNYSNYFLNGTIEKEGTDFQVTATLFNTKDGKEFYSKKYKNADPLAIVDMISEDFRKEVYVENELDANFMDLPVSNLFTNSLEALKGYSESIRLAHFEQNTAAAIKSAEQAVSLDPNFAMAYTLLSEYYIMVNQAAESKTAITKAMQLKDMLSERMQFPIKMGYVTFENPVKALSILEMWSQLYPMDFKPLELLILLYQQRSEVEKAKNTALRALENGHTGTVLLTLAKMENAQGHPQKALEYYDRFEKEFPHKVKDISGKGNIYLSQGDFDKAEAHFEKLLLLNPDKSDLIIKLADIQGKKGNPDQQVKLFDKALATEKQFMDSLGIMQRKELAYLGLGQINKYFELMDQRLQLMMRVAPKAQVESQMLMPFNIEAKIEKGEGGQALLDKLLAITGALDKTLIDWDCIAKINYYIYMSDVENTNKLMERCDEELKKLQTEVQMNLVYGIQARVNGDYPKAIKHMEILQEVSQIDPSHLAFVGEIYRLNKDYGKAEKQLLSSLKIDPYNAKLLYQLALTYHEQGKNGEAITTLKKTLDVWKNADADYIPAQEAKARLAEWE